MPNTQIPCLSLFRGVFVFGGLAFATTSEEIRSFQGSHGRCQKGSDWHCGKSSDLVGAESSDLSSTGRRLLKKLGGGGGGGGIRSNGLKLKESELHRDENCVFAVVAGRRLLLVELILGKDGGDGSGSFLLLKEIQCVDGVRTMVWLDDSIIVGSSEGYILYSCVTGQGGLIFSLPDPSSSPPRLKLLLKEQKVLLLVDNVGVMVNAQGQPVGEAWYSVVLLILLARWAQV